MGRSRKNHPKGAKRLTEGRSQGALPRRAASLVALFSLTWFSNSAALAEEPQATDDRTDPYELLDQIGQAIQVIETEYFEPADQVELLEGALRGMVGGLDPHSAYFSRSDLEIFEGSTKGKFGGIGVEVEFDDGEVIVIAPVEGSPAARAGIGPGDRIVALDSRPLIVKKPDELVRMMRGEIGTTLQLTIRKKGENSLRDVIVTREQISVSSVRSVLMKGGVAYFRIKAFQDGTHRELLAALGAMREQAGSLSGVLLDLRNNPGGLVREATAVADEFLSGGTIYSTRHRGKILKVEEAHRGGAFTTGPLVVLINEYSASAAELVAGALRDGRRAQLVGARSFGKGSVQTILNLGHGGALKLTTALYYTPSGRSVQALGVAPHVAVDPGYVQGPALRVLREADLEGHLLEDRKAEEGERGAPPTNEELHLGVARDVPEDPASSPDLTLRVAYQLARGTLLHPERAAPEKPASPSEAPTAPPEKPSASPKKSTPAQAP
jgi:carboxyl-terminal processing protease